MQPLKLQRMRILTITTMHDMTSQGVQPSLKGTSEVQSMKHVALSMDSCRCT
jgi:hypothetical protein